MEKMVKVMATARGHCGKQVREEGEVFEVPASLLAAKKTADGSVVPPTWFEEVIEQDVKTTQLVKKSEKGAGKKGATDDLV